MDLFGKYTTVFVALVVLLSVPVYATRPSFGVYPAQITLIGDLTLTGSGGQPTVVLPLNVNFASLVPAIILEGLYNDGGFHGVAIGPDEGGFIRYHGLLTVRLTNDKPISFWVNFVAEKPAEDDIPEGTYAVEGFVSVEISTIILPPEEITWVLMKGNVSEYTDARSGETNEAFGRLIAHAKIDENGSWAKVTSVFSTEPMPTRETEELSRSFYVATLASLEQIELDGGLTITGTWDVDNRTVSFNKVEGGETTITMTVTPIVQGAKGTLDATFTEPRIPWQAEGNFTLSIETFGKIEGSVVFFHTKLASPFDLGIPRADFNNDGKVNILDSVSIANAYSAKLGSPRYNLDFDVAPGGEPGSPSGPDFEINVLDLLVAAQEFGQEC